MCQGCVKWHYKGSSFDDTWYGSCSMKVWPPVIKEPRRIGDLKSYFSKNSWNDTFFIVWWVRFWLIFPKFSRLDSKTSIWPWFSWVKDVPLTFFYLVVDYRSKSDTPFSIFCWICSKVTKMMKFKLNRQSSRQKYEYFADNRLYNEMFWHRYVS